MKTATTYSVGTLTTFRKERDELFEELKGEHDAKLLDEAMRGDSDPLRKKYYGRDVCDECGQDIGGSRWDDEKIGKFVKVCENIKSAEAALYRQAMGVPE